MLRYIERVGLIEPERSSAGYRLYGPAELQRLRTLRELLAEHDVGLSDIAFARRLRDDGPPARRRPRRGSRPSPSVPTTSPPPTGCAGSRTSTSGCSQAAHAQLTRTRSIA